VIFTNNDLDAPRKYPWGIAVGADYWLDENDSRISRRPHFAYYPPIVWLTLPYTYFILAIATLGYLPWFPWSRRYSLRTLLAATTLVAALLGLIAWCR
jgi:hypothetical protein